MTVRLPAILVVFFLVASAWAEPTPVRRWTSQSEQQIEAMATSVMGHPVILEKSDGGKVKILTSRLSPEDQAFIDDHFRSAAPAVKLQEPEPAVEKPPWPVGVITDAITTEKKPEWSYHLYLPKSFSHGAEVADFVYHESGGRVGRLTAAIREGC